MEMDVGGRYGVDGRRLRQAREEAGLTVAALAGRTGIEPYQLALIEEQSHVPSLLALRRITVALSIPAHTVIEWGPPPFALAEPDGRRG